MNKRLKKKLYKRIKANRYMSILRFLRERHIKLLDKYTVKYRVIFYPDNNELTFYGRYVRDSVVIKANL